VSPVKYELGFYIPADDILRVSISLPIAPILSQIYPVHNITLVRF
jgi:hypothetical protein